MPIKTEVLLQRRAMQTANRRPVQVTFSDRGYTKAKAEDDGNDFSHRGAFYCGIPFVIKAQAADVLVVAER